MPSQRTVKKFGGLDILVNNASAISLTNTAETDMKRFDLMHQINTRGTYLCSKLAAPHLARSSNPHILMLAPPLNITERWFAPHLAYSLAKYGMSLCVLGLAGELRKQGIAVNALWPRTVIGTAALQVAMSGRDTNERRRVRKPEIVSDAAHVILTKPSRDFTGQFCLDEEVLRAAGMHRFRSLSRCGCARGGSPAGLLSLSSGVNIAPHNSIAGAAGLELVRCDDDALTAGSNPRTDFIVRSWKRRNGPPDTVLTLEDFATRLRTRIWPPWCTS